MLSPLCALPLFVGETPKSKKTNENEKTNRFQLRFPFWCVSCLFDVFSLCCVLTRVSFHLPCLDVSPLVFTWSPLVCLFRKENVEIRKPYRNPRKKKGKPLDNELSLIYTIVKYGLFSLPVGDGFLSVLLFSCVSPFGVSSCLFDVFSLCCGFFFCYKNISAKD